MGRHSAPTRRELRRMNDVITEIPPVTDREPAPSRRRAVTLGGVALASTVAVGLAAAAPQYGPDDTRPITSVADSILADAPDPADGFDRLSMLAASRAHRDAETVAAVQVQEASEAAAIERRAAEERAEAERVAAKARAAQEAREAAEAQAAAAQAEAVASAEPETNDDDNDSPSEQSTAPSQTSSGVIVPGARLTSGYGPRWGSFHAGIDLAAPLGTPIYSPFGGRVSKAGPSSGYGNAIIISTDEGDSILFGHMRVLEVSVGDRVNAGDLIAYVGNEGQSTGPHCHVEIRVGGATVNPVGYLSSRGVSV